MKNLILIALAFAVFCIPAAAQEEKKPMKAAAAPQDIEQKIIKINKETFDAMVKNDRSAADRYEMADHIFINPGGGLEIRGHTPGMPATFESAKSDEVRVRVYGDDTAVLTGRANIKGKLENGYDITGTYRYMTVYVKQDGEWRSAATSVVAIAPEPTPTAAQPKKPQ